jgi:hypothetical protein
MKTLKVHVSPDPSEIAGKLEPLLSVAWMVPAARI